MKTSAELKVIQPDVHFSYQQQCQEGTRPVTDLWQTNRIPVNKVASVLID
jgi:hypothetical protein